MNTLLPVFYHYTARIRCFSAIYVFAIGIFSAGLFLPQISFARQTAPPGQISFTYHESLIFIKVKVNQKHNLLFLLNTGANTTVLHHKTADQLHLPLIGSDSVAGNAGKEAVRLLQLGSLQAGNAVLRNLPVTRRNLSQWPRPANQQLDGILGTDFLKNFVVTIDYKRRKITFQKTKSAKRYQQNIPFNLTDGIPEMSISLNDSLSLPMRYNSGVSLAHSTDIFVNVSTAAWRKLKGMNLQLQPAYYMTGSAVGGHVYLPVVRIRTFNTADFRVNKPFIIVQPEEGYFKKNEPVGFFGNNFLEKFDEVCVNFPDKQISFNRPRLKNPDIVYHKPLPPAPGARKSQYSYKKR